MFKDKQQQQMIVIKAILDSIIKQQLMIRAEYVIILNLHVCGCLCVRMFVCSCVCARVCLCGCVHMCVCVSFPETKCDSKGGKPKHYNTNLNGDGEPKRPDNPKPPLNYKISKANCPMGD